MPQGKIWPQHTQKYHAWKCSLDIFKLVLKRRRGRGGWQTCQSMKSLKRTSPDVRTSSSGALVISIAFHSSSSHPHNLPLSPFSYSSSPHPESLPGGGSTSAPSPPCTSRSNRPSSPSCALCSCPARCSSRARTAVFAIFCTARVISSRAVYARHTFRVALWEKTKTKTKTKNKKGCQSGSNTISPSHHLTTSLPHHLTTLLTSSPPTYFLILSCILGVGAGVLNDLINGNPGFFRDELHISHHSHTDAQSVNHLILYTSGINLTIENKYFK